MREKDKEKTDRFIESLYYFEVTREIAKLARQLRRKYTKKGQNIIYYRCYNCCYSYNLWFNTYYQKY